MTRPVEESSVLPDVRVGQIWADNDWRADGRLLKVIEVPSLDVPNPGEVKVLVEVVRGRWMDRAGTIEEAHLRGNRRWVKLRRFRPTSTGYRPWTPEDDDAR